MNHEDGENRGDQGLEPRGRHTGAHHDCDADQKGDVLEKVDDQCMEDHSGHAPCARETGRGEFYAKNISYRCMNRAIARPHFRYQSDPSLTPWGKGTCERCGVSSNCFVRQEPGSPGITTCQPFLTTRVNLGRRVRHGIDSG